MTADDRSRRKTMSSTNLCHSACGAFQEGTASPSSGSSIAMQGQPSTRAPSRSPTSPDNGVRVAEGLAKGDLVVSAGTQFMKEDMKVKLPETVASRFGRPAAYHRIRSRPDRLF